MAKRFFRNIMFLVLWVLLFSLAPCSAFAQEEYELSPREAAPGDQDVQLTLTGPGLGSFGELIEVALSDYILDFGVEIIDDEMFWVFVSFPMDVPVGEQRMVFVFQETQLVFPFYIFDPVSEEQSIFLENVFPVDAPLGSEFEIFLEGPGMPRLGEPDRVEIGGIPLEIWDYEGLNEREVRMILFVPENVPIGENEIRFIFGEAVYDWFFTVYTFPGEIETEEPPDTGRTPIPPSPDTSEGGGFDLPGWLLFLGIIVVGGGLVLALGAGLLISRLARKPAKRNSPGAPNKLEFRHDKDKGIQQILPVNKPISLEGDFRIDTDYEHIETSVDQTTTIIDRDDETAGGL